MENRWIQNQIAIYMTNKKLVEFNDKLKPAPIEYYAHIHAQGEKVGDGSRPRSCIGMVLQDYSNGTGEKTVRVMANLSPEFFRYMSVMNIDVAYIACLFSNHEDDFVWQRIDRDLEDEENTIGLLESFWKDNVCAQKEPPLVEKPDLVLETIANFSAQADKSLPALNLDAQLAGALEQIFQWKEEKTELDRKSRQLDGKIKSAYAPIVELMGATCTASCDTGDGTRFFVSYNPNYREVIPKDQLSQLRAQYPEIYRDFVENKVYRTFEIRKTAC